MAVQAYHSIKKSENSALFYVIDENNEIVAVCHTHQQARSKAFLLDSEARKKLTRKEITELSKR